MKKYLLLRSNRETGPHSFEQLGSMGLLPTDLIWIEDESTSWSYPEEIEELKVLVKHESSDGKIDRRAVGGQVTGRRARDCGDVGDELVIAGVDRRRTQRRQR